MEELDPNKFLPSDIVIEGVDDILFDIGLLLTSFREDQKKRKFIYNPRVLLIINTIVLLNKLSCLFIDDSNELVLKLLGEFGQYYGLKNNLCTVMCLLSIIVLFSQWVYYYNYKHGIKPSFLNVFHMISGSVTAYSVGLTSDVNVVALMKNLKLTIKFLKFNNNVICVITAFLYFLIGQMINKTIVEIILIVLPLTFIFNIWAHYVWNIILYQILYFFILCRYLRIKLQNLNECALRIKNSYKYSNISTLLPNINALYREINEYNVSYWSKFLLIIWLFFGTLIVIIINLAIRKKLIFIIRITAIYGVLCYSGLFLFTILTAASVNNTANKSYKLLHSIMSSHIHRSKSIQRKLKVNIFIFSHFYTKIF